MHLPQWTPDDVERVFDRFEETGIPKILRFLGTLLEPEDRKPSPPVSGSNCVPERPVQSELLWVDFSRAAKEVGVTSRTLHNYMQVGRISEVRQLSPKRFQISRTDLERLKQSLLI